MLKYETQNILVKACGDVFMYYVINWQTLKSHFCVKCHDHVEYCDHIGCADNCFNMMCKHEQKGDEK